MGARKVLIITYYWPPSGGVGVQRWMNFALQLKKLNWEPIVLTPDNPQFDIKDKGLLERVTSIKRHTIPIWEPFAFFHKLTGQKEKENVRQGLVMEKKHQTFKDRLTVWIRGNLFIPDPRVFWVRNAAKFALDLIRKDDIATVITTGPPHSMHLIGRRIKKKSGVKWLADFRDPWSKWDVLAKLKTSDLAMLAHKHLESKVLKEADQVTTVSPRLAKSLGCAQVLYNGVTPAHDTGSLPDDNHFTIGYFGMLNELRNPSQLWLLLDQMCRENTDFDRRLRIKIGGIVSGSILDELSKLKKLKSKIDFIGYVPHEEVQKEYQKCDLLLLLLNKSSNSEWILPVKFFEYVAAKRSIICLGSKESDLGDILKTVSFAEIFDYTEIPFIRSFITDLAEDKSTPQDGEINQLLDQFSHERGALNLDKLLSSLHEY